jgi:hypothetical protein
MGKTMKRRKGWQVETTLGELIAAAGEVAFEYSNNDKDAYDLARLALIELIRKTSHPIEFDKDFESLSSPTPLASRASSSWELWPTLFVLSTRV